MFCAYPRPRYQVSVYTTIGPLVIFNLSFLWLFVAFKFQKDNFINLPLSKLIKGLFMAEQSRTWLL